MDSIKKPWKLSEGSWALSLIEKTIENINEIFT